ncbi:MAG: glycoside hydrolase family 65 protein [Microthrixaceae bacterium]|nr:glycoside hydrolase family 65 protein [Microthrixaceae bacterium]
MRFEGFEPDDEGRREALATLANGYWSVRGAAPEASADGVHYPGTYVAGVYNRLDDEVKGRTVTNESLVNLPNWLLLGFRVDGGPWFAAGASDLLDHEVELDTHQAVLRRLVRFRDDEGRITRVEQRRFVHHGEPHLAALITTFTAENWTGPLTVRSGIDGDVENANVDRYRTLASTHLEVLRAEPVDDETVLVEVQTTQSKVRVAVAARTRVVDGAGGDAPGPVLDGGLVAHDLALDLAEGVPVTVEKVVSLFTSRDLAITEPAVDALRTLGAAPDAAALEEAHVLQWAHVWRRGDIDIDIDDGDEDPPPEIALRVNLFHLLQTVTKNTADLDVGVPARGLHGEAYRGHIFWDELFIFPYLNLRFPKLTRGLLLYRYRRLPEARRAAAEAGYRGAMFPWQSGSNGEEETQTWHLNPNSGRWLPDGSHLQRHVNIAIAYNVWQYYDATGSYEFLSFYGAELLLEIARFWASMAEQAPDGRYDIVGVVGPDEYHEAYPGADEPGLRNNAYTNVMAAWVLTKALALGEVVTEHRCRELREKLGIDEAEVARWDDISRRLRVPFHDGVISQFEGYGDLDELDWEGYRERYGDIRRLDRVLEAEGDSTNRYRLSKQADVLMLLYLLTADEVIELFGRLGYDVDQDLLDRTTAYYLDRTSHGSSLSGVVHTWLMVGAGREASWPLFADALESDLAGGDGGTVREGIHLGAMAGTVDLVQRGYGGVRPRGGVLWVEPSLPPEIARLRFNVGYRGASVTVDVEDGECTVTAHPNAQAIRVGIEGEVVALAPCEERSFPVARRR